MNRDPDTPSLRRHAWSVVLAVILLILFKDRSLISNPRFSAEEGNFFYMRAATGFPVLGLHWLDVGYLDLVPVTAAVAAAYCFPIEVAPLVTSLVALLVHLMPALIIAF